MVTGNDPYHSGWELEHGWDAMQQFFIFIFFSFVCDTCDVGWMRNLIHIQLTYHTLTKLRKTTQNIPNDSKQWQEKMKNIKIKIKKNKI